MGTIITPTEERIVEWWTFLARLTSIVHQWTSIGKFWAQTQAILTFVFPDEMKDWDKFCPSAKVFVSVSTGQNAQFFTLLRKLWIDTTKPFDLEDAIGKECQVTCTVNDGYFNANHKDVANLVKWVVVPKYKTDTQFFWFTADYEWDVKRDEKWEPILDEKTGKEQPVKISCSNVTMTWFDCLNEKQIDKVVQSREYNWLQKNWVNKPTESETDSMPF